MLRIVALEALALAPLVLPFAVLFGTHAALLRLVRDRELLASATLGVRLASWLAPLAIFSAVAATLALALSFGAGPWAVRTRDALFASIDQASPWDGLVPGAVLRVGGWQLTAQEVGPGGVVLDRVVLGRPDRADPVFARRARLRPVRESGEIAISLEDGATLAAAASGGRRARFDVLGVRLPARRQAGVAVAEVGFEGLGLRELGARARAFVPRPGEAGSLAGRAWQRRVAAPLLTLFLGMLAAPLSLVSAWIDRRCARGAGLAMGLVWVALGWGALRLGDIALRAGALGPAASLWLPLGVLALIGVEVTRRALRRSAHGPVFAPSHVRARPRPPETRDTHATVHLHPRRHALFRWVAGRFLRLAAGCFLALLIAGVARDVVEHLGWLAAQGSSGVEWIRFHGARLPWVAAAAIPLSLCVAGSLLVSRMAADGTLTGLRASGISGASGVLPALFVCALLAPAPFLLRSADAAWGTSSRAPGTGIAPAREWRLTDTWLIEAEAIDLRGGSARELVLYRLDDEGTPIRRIDARYGRNVGDGVWRLEGATGVEAPARAPGDATAPRFVHLGEAPWSQADARGLGTGALVASIADLENAGLDAWRERAALHARLAETLACVVLPALTLLLSVARVVPLAPLPAVLSGAAIGALYLLVVGASSAAAPTSPIAAGWTPALLFAVAAGMLALRAGRRSR